MKRFKKWKWQSTEYFEFMKKKSIFENVMAIFLKDMPSKEVILPVLAFEKNSDERLGKTKKMSK